MTRLQSPGRLKWLNDSTLFKKHKMKIKNIFVRLHIAYSVLVSLALLVIFGSPLNAQSMRLPDKAFDEKVKQTLKKNAATLRFMENKGQFPGKNVLYYFEGSNGSAFIEPDKIRFVAYDKKTITSTQENGIKKKEHITKATHTFTLSFKGCNSNIDFVLGTCFKTKYNFFLGNNADDAVKCVNAAKDLTIKNIYDGIDLRLYSSEDGLLEFDWILAPGADLHKIALMFDGQDNLFIDKKGSLFVGLHFTSVKFSIPECYQVSDTGKIPVSLFFDRKSNNTITFINNSKIDPKLGLVIDPLLNWGTLLDGNNSSFDEYLFAIQVDSTNGMVYCAGTTNRQISTNTAPYDANGYNNTIGGLSGGTGVSSLPNVAIIYRIDSSGTDLVDLTLYGPASVSSSNLVTAYALSLSPNYVFIGGSTNVNIPLAGSSFDNVRNNTDGYIAVFSRDLGTLVYSTYLGGTGAESRGVTSIRAIDDSSFVAGMTAAVALPTSNPNYISAGAAQTSFGGGTDFYLAHFTGMNTLIGGTYVGGSGNETFNDLEVLANGNIAFCGYTNGTFSLTNSVGHSGSGEDGVIGVLAKNGKSFKYLDRIGGAGNDRFYDVEVVGDSLYFSGSGATGFPTTAGAYDQTYNGGSSDAVIGVVNAGGGSLSYKATYYGTTGNDFGDGIRLVTKKGCPTSETLILAFGTVAGSGLPVTNVKNEPFYNAAFTPGGNLGLDMFFSGFTNDLTTLKYGTYMGGTEDDYLGATGDPRGANQLWVNGTNAYVGTTTHSSSHTPELLKGGFDDIKSNSNNDAHIIFSIAFGGIFDTVSLDPISATSNKFFVCPGEPAVLTVHGGSLGTNANWTWYSNSCGNSFIDSGASITVYPLATTTYYVRAEGSCNTTQCTQVTVPMSCILHTQSITLNGTVSMEKANLSWKIVTDEKIRQIELARSTDAINFTIIKSVIINDYASSNEYTANDDVSLLNEKFVYYRVKTEDENGENFYSKIIQLPLAGKITQPVLVPNPASTEASLNFYITAAAKVEIQLFNSLGKLLRRSYLNASAGFNSFYLTDLAILPKGIYFVSLDNTTHLKLIIR